MKPEQMTKFEAGLNQIKATPQAGEKWGWQTTSARVLNLLCDLGERVTVTTDPECDTCGGNTYFMLPAECVPVAERLGLRQTMFCRKLENSKVVTDAAKKFHASETYSRPAASEQEDYIREERRIDGWLK